MFGLAISNIDCKESNDSYGRFEVEPLEKGFGTTIGNALRRVLLGFLPGAAVTKIKIEGVQHEFAPIPYVKEDVLEFILNVKALRLKALSGTPARLSLEKQKEGAIYARDINPSLDYEIVNPDLYLATVDSPEARFYVDFAVALYLSMPFLHRCVRLISAYNRFTWVKSPAVSVWFSKYGRMALLRLLML